MYPQCAYIVYMPTLLVNVMREKMVAKKYKSLKLGKGIPKFSIFYKRF